MSGPNIGDLVWHVHHDALCEPLTESFKNRVAYIQSQKLASEVPTRLRLMKPVWGKLPDLDKARAELLKARAELLKAGAGLGKALRHPSVLALHAKECLNCPWDGTTIFPPAEQEAGK